MSAAGDSAARGSPAAAGGGRGDAAFLGASALLFLGSATATVLWCGSMAGGMPMPGGWTMSMAWMRMPGQSWAGAAASFLGMWGVMMAAMMLPSLVPMLSGYRRSLGGTPAGSPTLLAGAGYFLAWAGFGAAVYPLGLLVAAGAMRWPALARSVPLLTGAAFLAAGLLQLSAWKARHLEHCRCAASCAHLPRPGPSGALRHGLRLGLHCGLCCSGYVIALLAAGVMDVGAMALLAAAITAERLGPWPGRVARAAGGALLMAGAVAIARSVRGG